MLAVAVPLPVAAEVSAVELGDEVVGELTPGDGVLSAGQLFDEVRFAGNAGQEVLIGLLSPDFDPFLWLVGPSGEVLTIDDDSFARTGAAISRFTLPRTGEYSLWVSSFAAGETGAYRLRTSEAPHLGGAAALVEGRPRKGRLGAEDPRLGSGHAYDLYTFEATSGKVLTLSMRSKGGGPWDGGSGRFAPFLWLMDEEGRVVAAAESVRNESRITFAPLAAGTFTVLASAAAPRVGGPYSLVLQGEARAPQAPPLAASVDGELTAADLQLATGQYLDVYGFEAEAGDEVSLRLSSADFDAFLILLDAEGRILASADDSAGGFDAAIDGLVLPETGRYFVWVRSVFGGATGGYRLVRAVSTAALAKAAAKEAQQRVTVSFKSKGSRTAGSRAKGGRPFIDADRCVGSTAIYTAKVEICIGDQGPLNDSSVVLSGPSGVVINPSNKNSRLPRTLV